MDDEDNGIGVGVFFSNSKAVTADHNLTVDQALGTKIVVKIPELQEQLTLSVLARHSEMDYAILQSNTNHAYLPVYVDPPKRLLGADLVLARCSFDLEGWLTEAEKSIDAIVNGGVAQGCCALLSSVFTA
ncbi:hypothetical protein WJX79_000109 [Trebouxia sp. C0005]